MTTGFPQEFDCDTERRVSRVLQLAWKNANGRALGRFIVQPAQEPGSFWVSDGHWALRVPDANWYMIVALDPRTFCRNSEYYRNYRPVSMQFESFLPQTVRVYSFSELEVGGTRVYAELFNLSARRKSRIFGRVYAQKKPGDAHRIIDERYAALLENIPYLFAEPRSGSPVFGSYTQTRDRFDVLVLPIIPGDPDVEQDHAIQHCLAGAGAQHDTTGGQT